LFRTFQKLQKYCPLCGLLDKVIQTFRDATAKHVVTLLRERQLVDCVMNEASFQQVAGIATSVTAVNEAFNMAVQPVYHL